MKKFVTIVGFVCLFLMGHSQDSLQTNFHKKSILDYSLKPNKKRIALVTSTLAVGYVTTMSVLSQEWYKGYPQSKFHFFNDIKEWNQIDKGGHIFSAYFETVASYNLYRWSGANRKNAALFAGLTGFLSQSSIEILDGLSSQWGASWSDIGANAIGAGIASSQYLAWGEQRFTIKISPHLNSYPAGELRDRAHALYGTGPLNLILKDYNNINFWLSVNPWSFDKKSTFPRWLNFTVGYGAGNLYGGFSNVWTDKNGVIHNRNDITRYRKILIGIDYDLTKIKTNKKGIKLLLGILNCVKLPAPALEFNTLGQVVFHPNYFLNFEMPIYLKR